jgi:nitrous oxide reductase accessory protein NosL
MKNILLLAMLAGGMLLAGCDRQHDKDERPVVGSLLPGGDVRLGGK